MVYEVTVVHIVHPECYFKLPPCLYRDVHNTKVVHIHTLYNVAPTDESCQQKEVVTVAQNTCKTRKFRVKIVICTWNSSLRTPSEMRTLL